MPDSYGPIICFQPIAAAPPVRQGNPLLQGREGANLEEQTVETEESGRKLFERCEWIGITSILICSSAAIGLGAGPCYQSSCGAGKMLIGGGVTCVVCSALCTACLCFERRCKEIPERNRLMI